MDLRAQILDCGLKVLDANLGSVLPGWVALVCLFVCLFFKIWRSYLHNTATIGLLCSHDGQLEECSQERTDSIMERDVLDRLMEEVLANLPKVLCIPGRLGTHCELPRSQSWMPQQHHIWC